jgi:hypothetical protein
MAAARAVFNRRRAAVSHGVLATRASRPSWRRVHWSIMRFS